MAIIIRRLGPTSYGQWATATALVATAAVLSNLGIRGTFIRDLSRNPSNAEAQLARQLGTQLLLRLLAGIIVVAVVSALHYANTIVQCVLIATGGMLLSSIATTMSDFFEARERFPGLAVVSLVSGTLLTAASVVAVWLGGGPVWLTWSYLVGPLIAIAMLLAMLRRTGVRFTVSLWPRDVREQLSQSRHFTVQHVLVALSSNVPLLLLPRIISADRFGLFSAGILLVTRLSILPESLATASYPAIAKLFQQSRQRAQKQTLHSLVVAVLLCLCVAVVICLLAGTVAAILFPRSPGLCHAVILITIWALPLTAAEYVVGYSLNAAGREAAQARASIYATGTTLVLAIVLILEGGIWGACWFMVIRPALQVAFTCRPFIETFLMDSPTRAAVETPTDGDALAEDIPLQSAALSSPLLIT